MPSQKFPERCPFVVRSVPKGCRFHHKLIARLIGDGTLDAKRGCPLFSVCKLRPDYIPLKLEFEQAKDAPEEVTACAETQLEAPAMEQRKLC